MGEGPPPFSNSRLQCLWNTAPGLVLPCCGTCRWGRKRTGISSPNPGKSGLRQDMLCGHSSQLGLQGIWLPAIWVCVPHCNLFAWMRVLLSWKSRKISECSKRAATSFLFCSTCFTFVTKCVPTVGLTRAKRGPREPRQGCPGMTGAICIHFTEPSHA